jgi:RND family efflux transporter MFP subunit
MSARCYSASTVAIVLALGAASSCSRASETVRAEPSSARTVAVVRVGREDLRRTLDLAAEFRPYQEIDLHAKVAGFVKAIYVDIGDRVAPGQLIAELEAPEMAQEFDQADAALKRAQVEIERSRADLRRSEAEESARRIAFDRLSGVVKVRSNLVAQQDVDDAHARLEIAAAQLASAKASVAAAEEQSQIAAAARERASTLLTYLRIVAPFGGTVTKRLADTGAMIQSGTASHVQAMPVVQLSQVDRLRLVLPVPESVVPRIRLGGPVEVRVDALQRVFQGQVSRFSGKLDTSTRTMETEVDLPNPDLTIKAGMVGYATLVLDERPSALALPIQALASRSIPIKVLVVGPDHRLQERTIETGLETPTHIEVTSGLRDGDVVVVGARSDLRAGMNVDAKDTGSSGDTH